MTFMKDAVNHSIDIWNKCVETPFVQGLKTGELPHEKFKRYMIQDSIYLKHYARVFGRAIYNSTVLRDIQLYCSLMSFVADSESIIRLNYLKRFNISDDDIELLHPLPENKNYIDFMLEAAEGEDICKMLMAISPCMLSYSYIARKIASEPIAKTSQYWDFIQDYANDNFYENCKRLEGFSDDKCNSLTNSKKEELKTIFEKASLLELDFWRMSYQE